MPQGTADPDAAPARAQERRASSVRAALADPQIVSVLVYTAIAMACTVVGYLLIFSGFTSGDDEGTLLVTLDAFVRGDTLYQDIYTPYGPFYFELFGGFFAATGLPVSTDASRTIVVVVWVAASLLFGLAAQRTSGRISLGAVSMIASFACLQALIAEPMHPHGLGVLLLAAFTLLAVAGDRRPALFGGLCGGLLAALVLTKLNLGAFAIAAIALAAVMAYRPLADRRWIRWPVIAAFLLMPLIVMARDLDQAWVRDLILLEALAAGALIAAAWSREGESGDDRAIGRWLLVAMVGFVLATVAILVAILATGPSPADLYDGIVSEAMRVRDVLLLPLPFPSAAVSWGVGAVALAVIVRLMRAGPESLTIWPAVLRGAAGLIILFSVTNTAPVSLNPAAENPIVIPMLLAWVAAIPPAGPRPPYETFVRVLLPALALAETLQVYPVAGSQMRISAVVFIPVAIICLNDALTALSAWSREGGLRSTGFAAEVAPVLLVAVVGVFALNALARPAFSSAVTYSRNDPLPFPDATLLRLPEPETETYTYIVRWLQEERCTSFIGYPNINSLYLWSGIEPPPPSAPGAWIEALDSEAQQRIVDSLRASPRPCGIRNESIAAGWLGGEPPPDRPLVRYIFDDLRPVDRVGEFELLLPRARAG